MGDIEKSKKLLKRYSVARIPFISATVHQVIDRKLFTTMTLVAITEEVFMDRH